jgi:hypothetical protein
LFGEAFFNTKEQRKRVSRRKEKGAMLKVFNAEEQKKRVLRRKGFERNIL